MGPAIVPTRGDSGETRGFRFCTPKRHRPPALAQEWRYWGPGRSAIMFGGCGTYCTTYWHYYDDTWLYTQGVPSLISPATSPPNSFGMSMTYDERAGKVILFGGCDGNACYSTTWLFSGGTWSAINPNPSPPARALATMAYDPVDGYTVLTGGEYCVPSGPSCSGGYYLTDTWTFANNRWTNITNPNQQPGDEAGAALAFDAYDGYMVMFGGCEPPSACPYPATWEFLHGTWTVLSLIILSEPPNLLDGCTLTYDPVRQGLILFGGDSGPILHITWRFGGPLNPGNWTNLTAVFNNNQPPSRAFQAMATDYEASSLVMFAGSPDTQWNTMYADTWRMY